MDNDENENEYFDSVIYSGELERMIAYYIKKYSIDDFLEYLVDILRYRI